MKINIAPILIFTLLILWFVFLFLSYETPKEITVEEQIRNEQRITPGWGR